jgi:hypothetical protein
VGIEESLVAAVLALFVVGITLAARASTRLLRHHRAITTGIDWEWVVALHRSQNPVDQKGT